MDSRDVKDDKEIYFKMLSKVQNDEGDTLSPFLWLDFCQPVLSLGDGGLDVIYFTANIPEHFEPGPACTWPAHEPYWAGVGRDLEAREFFLARARPKMLFLVVLHYKMRGRPAQARVRPEPGSKIKAQCVQWDGHG
jgi:hypothetical protein